MESPQTPRSSRKDEVFTSKLITNSKGLERIRLAINIIQKIDYTDVQEHRFLSPLYLTTALDRNINTPGPGGKVTRLEYQDTVNSVLRKNIYYLASISSNVPELIILANKRGLTTQNDRDELVSFWIQFRQYMIEDTLADNFLKSVTLFSCLIKKSANELPVPMFIEILKTSGNEATARILEEKINLSTTTSHITTAINMLTVAGEPEVVLEGASGGSIQVPNPDEWSCQSCTFLNAKSAKVCSMCYKSKDFMSMHDVTINECYTCTFINKPEAETCEVCSTAINTKYNLTGRHMDKHVELDSSEDDGDRDSPFNW